MHVMSNVWLCLSTCFISLAQSIDHPLFLDPYSAALLIGVPLTTSSMNASFCPRILLTHLAHS